MCFSVQASFLSGILLLVIGALSIKSVRFSRSYPFAAIPLLFGLQQCTEGSIWLAFMYDLPPVLFVGAVFAFLFFALCIWPVYIPYAFLHLEPFSPYRNFMRVLACVGAFGAVSFLCMMFYYGVGVMPLDNHIFYVVAAPWLEEKGAVFLLLIPYAVCVLAPFILSAYEGVRYLGGAILCALLITLWFWFVVLTSVWCFFAAILSSGIAYCVVRYKM